MSEDAERFWTARAVRLLSKFRYIAQVKCWSRLTKHPFLRIDEEKTIAKAQRVHGRCLFSSGTDTFAGDRLETKK